MNRFLLLILWLLWCSPLLAQQVSSYRPFAAGFKALPKKVVVKKPKDTITKLWYTTYYAKKFEGRRTTSGEIYRAAKYTAAHRTLPFGTRLWVKNLRTGKSVAVRVNDRGPFSQKFQLDISESAAKAIGIYRLGYAKLQVKYIRSK